MDFSKFLHGFFKFDIWISQSCYMDFSKLIHEFVRVAPWICKRCSIYFSPFAKQNKAEVWPRFQCLLKLLLSTNGVEWVKVPTQFLGSVVPLTMFLILFPHTRCSIPWCTDSHFDWYTIRNIIVFLAAFKIFAKKQGWKWKIMLFVSNGHNDHHSLLLINALL